MSGGKFSFPEIQTQGDIEWFKDELGRSGIADKIADENGLQLKPGKYLIPYHDIDGESTHLVKARVRGAESVDKYTKTDARYITVTGVGLGALPYWPRFPGLHHRKELANLDHSLWITEGEKKAICLQSQIIAQGYTGSAVALGGVSWVAALIKDLDSIVFSAPVGSDIAHRRVVMVLDWNEQNELVRLSEEKIYLYLKERGAEVTILRWGLPDGAGEQKIDDWLVAGGKLSDALLYSEARAEEIAPVAVAEVLTTSRQYFNANYGKWNGKIVRLSDAHILAAHEFKTQYLHRYTVVPAAKGRPQKVRHAEDWLEWSGVRHIDGVCFSPWSPGSEREHPEVLGTMLNLFRGWQVKPIEGDVTPWLQHLDHVLPHPEQRDWFIKWVAHMVQHPDQIVSTYVCLVSQRQGTGKGLVAEGLRTMLGANHVTRATREEWLGRFNSSWGGALMIYTDEVKTRNPREDQTMGERIKEYVGSPVIVVERKGKDVECSIDNYLRFLFTGNREKLTFVDAHDRRAAYFEVPVVLDPAIGAALKEWYKLPNTRAALLGWALSVELGDWSPGQRAPMTEAKQEAVRSNMSEMEQFVEDVHDGVILAGKDIWEAMEIYRAFESIYNRYHGGPRNFSAHLKKLGLLGIRTGALTNVYRVRSHAVRLWSVREHDKWAVASLGDWVDEAEKNI